MHRLLFPKGGWQHLATGFITQLEIRKDIDAYVPTSQNPFFDDRYFYFENGFRCSNKSRIGLAQKPNIILILADDLGYGDVQVLNHRSSIPTPNINRLAKEGMTFTDAHSPSAVCTPTRYGLLTGRYCWRTTLKRGVLNGYGETVD